MGEIRGNIMKKNAYKIACGLTAVSAIALVLSACESDSSPVICTCEPSESCNNRDISSSSEASTYPAGKKHEQCFTFESMCPPCDGDDCPIYYQPCTYCGGMLQNDTLVECGTGDIYICGIGDEWVPDCVHLIDSDGTAKKNLKCSINLFETKDCNTGKPLICKEYKWQEKPEEIASSSSTEISSSTERIGRMEPGCFDIERACPPCDENECINFVLPCNHCIGSLGDSIASCDGNGIYVCEANYWVKKSNGQSGNSSSSSAVTISSSAVASSSSAGRVGEKHEKCFEYERMCPPCNEEPCPIPVVACNDCGGMENDTLVECGSNDLYICKESYWESYCVHMKDSSGVAKADIPCHHEHAIAKDCDTDGKVICREGTWHALTENDSWVGEPCTEQGKIKTIPLDYKTVKGASFSINLRYYCNYGKWTEVHTNEPLKDIPCVTGDTVTVGKTTYECDEGTWFDSERRAIARKDCSASPLIGADCTESDEWVYDVGCAYHCRDGKYSLE